MSEATSIETLDAVMPEFRHHLAVLPRLEVLLTDLEKALSFARVNFESRSLISTTKAAAYIESMLGL